MKHEWRNKASCKGQPSEVFFPPPGRYATRLAKQICARCPVQAECLAWAIEQRIPDGVFGGLDIRQRRVIAPELRQAECGTTSGYRRHRTAGDDACEPCLAAHRDAVAGYRRKAALKKVQTW